MAPLSLKIIMDDGAVTRKVKFDTKTTVREAHNIVKEKVIVSDPTKEYALFLRSADNNLAGIWLEHHRPLDYYMLREGDSLDYICKIRNLRVKLLDGSVKTLQVDEEKTVSQLMEDICGRLGIINHDEYGLSPEGESLLEEKKNKQPEERDVAFETLSRTLHTDDNVVWLDQHRTLREQRIETNATVILKRRLFYSDRNVDSRDPIQLNLLYVQTRDAILSGHHLVTEDQALVCKSRWVNMRDMMRRKIRDRLRNPNAHSYKYKYEDSFAFMLPFFKEGLTTTNNDEYMDFIDDNTSQVEMPTEVFVEENLDYEQSIRETKPYVKKRHEETNSSRDISFQEHSFQELSATDPLDVFLLSIGATLRTLSPYYLNQAKSKIFQIVQEYELQQIMSKDDQTPGTSSSSAIV